MLLISSTLMSGGADVSDDAVKVDLRRPACFRHKRVLGQLSSYDGVYISRLLVGFLVLFSWHVCLLPTLSSSRSLSQLQAPT